MLERCNRIRKRIPFWYWLWYDLVLLPLVIWAVLSDPLFIPAAVTYAIAVFFDISEAIVKYSRGYKI